MSKNLYKEEFPIAFNNYIDELTQYMENNPHDHIFKFEFFSTSRATKYKEWLKKNKRNVKRYSEKKFKKR